MSGWTEWTNVCCSIGTALSSRRLCQHRLCLQNFSHLIHRPTTCHIRKCSIPCWECGATERFIEEGTVVNNHSESFSKTSSSSMVSRYGNNGSWIYLWPAFGEPSCHGEWIQRSWLEFWSCPCFFKRPNSLESRIFSTGVPPLLMHLKSQMHIKAAEFLQKQRALRTTRASGITEE